MSLINISKGITVVSLAFYLYGNASTRLLLFLKIYFVRLLTARYLMHTRGYVNLLSIKIE